MVLEKITTTTDEAYEMSFIEMCNWLSYFTDRDDYIKQKENADKNIMTT